jgi:hypothetical protein
MLFFAQKQPQGEAGDVLEEGVLGGIVCLLCPALLPRIDVHLVYIPASGELLGRECKLASSFVKEFLDRPRRPQPGEYAPFSPRTHLLDLVDFASGHMPLEIAKGGRPCGIANAQTPQKHGRFGKRPPRVSWCGMSRMGGVKLGPDAGSSQAAAADSEKA